MVVEHRQRGQKHLVKHLVPLESTQYPLKYWHGAL